MAHFAELDENNVVLQVVVVHNNELLDENNEEQESLGIAFLNTIFGEGKTWKQCSYNSTFRKNYPNVGDSYDSSRDAFIMPQPYTTWILNETTCDWEAPNQPIPDDVYDENGVCTGHYYWSDDEYTANGNGWVLGSPNVE